VKLIGQLEPAALRILRAIPGLTVVVEPPSAGAEEVILGFGDSEALVTVRVRSRANAATASQLVQEADARPDTPDADDRGGDDS
jgi:hypothetical protein